MLTKDESSSSKADAALESSVPALVSASFVSARNCSDRQMPLLAQTTFGPPFLPLLARRLLAQTTFGPDHFWPDFGPQKLAQKSDHFWPAPSLTTFGPDHFWPAHPLTIHNVKMTFGNNPGCRRQNNTVRVRVKASRAEGRRRLHTNTAYAHFWVEGPKVGV